MAGGLPQCMGLGYGLGDSDNVLKRKFRWLLSISGVCADDNVATGIHCLPPKKAARPTLSFKEHEFQSLTETIFFPFKPEWKPITLSLYDNRCNRNPVFDWLRYTQAQLAFGQPGNGFYNPQTGAFNPVVTAGLKRNAYLNLYDGCGVTIEIWTLENVYPSSIEWGDLDMEDSGIVTVDVSLRYDRAYILTP